MHWSLIVHSPMFVKALQGAGFGALAGWAAAARVDYMAFQSWKTWHDVSTYDWGTAIFRWIHGALAGAVAGTGLGAILS